MKADWKYKGGKMIVTCCELCAYSGYDGDFIKKIFGERKCFNDNSLNDGKYKTCDKMMKEKKECKYFKEIEE